MGRLAIRIAALVCGPPRTTSNERQCRYPPTLTSLSAGGLLRFVENPPTLWAADDFLFSPDFQDGLVGNLHVAASADAVLDGDKRNAVLALEEAVVAVEQILIEALGEAWAL